jgi:diaminohydroxyphosphoribosylaminopyrimidine deaminase/5-amino-6-(5-phosphoribosylamino)uracil reductase
VRAKDISCEQPLRVVVDSRLRIPHGAKTLQLPGDVLIATAVTSKDLLADKNAALANDRVTIVSMPDAAGRVDLEKLLRYLAAEKQCNDVLLETGAELAGAMLDAKLIDEVITFVAPKLLGSEARPLFSLPGIKTMADQVSLEFLDVAIVGKDCRMRSRVIYPD